MKFIKGAFVLILLTVSVIAFAQPGGGGGQPGGGPPPGGTGAPIDAGVILLLMAIVAYTYTLNRRPAGIKSN